MTEIIAWLLLAIACGIAAFLLGQLNSAKSRLRELEDWEQRAITAENQLASAQALLQRTETELGQTKSVDEALQKRINIAIRASVLSRRVVFSFSDLKYFFECVLGARPRLCPVQ